MAVMEITGLADEVTELCPFKSPRRPIDLCIRTRPSLVAEHTRKRFAEGSVEAGIVGDNKIGRGDKSLDGLHVDLLAGDHVIGDPGQLDDFRGDWFAGLLQTAINPGHVSDYTLVVKGKGDQADFDNLFIAMIKTGGFGIENNSFMREFRA